MEKYFKIMIMGAALITLGLVGCDEQEVAAPISPDGYPTATITTDFSGSAVAEGDTIWYNITVDKPFDRNIEFSAHVVEGTASDGDLEVLGGVLPAYGLTTQLGVVFTRDYAADVDETAVVEVGVLELGQRYMLNPKTVNSQIEVTIANYVSDDLEMVFSWEATIDVNPGYADFPDFRWHESTYDWMDFDIFIADAEGYDNDDPWATFNDAIYAATGDTPEEMTFSGLADGSYVIFCELWYNGFVDSTELGSFERADKLVPITATFTRQGSFEKTLVQDLSQTFSSASQGVDNPDYVDEVVDSFVAGVTIADGNYTITDYAGAEIVTGKIENLKIKSKRPDYLRK